MRQTNEQISEHTLRDILSGPTNLENAERLAAYVFGRGQEYDERDKTLNWIPSDTVHFVTHTTYPFARILTDD